MIKQNKLIMKQAEFNEIASSLGTLWRYKLISGYTYNKLYHKSRALTKSKKYTFQESK